MQLPKDSTSDTRSRESKGVGRPGPKSGEGPPQRTESNIRSEAPRASGGRSGAPSGVQKSVTVEGVGPDQPTEFTSLGGEQSQTPYRFDLLDPAVLFETARILKHGSKYGVDNWRLISVDDNLNHCLQHIFAFMAGDTQEPHLAHAMCRLMFAYGVELQGGPGKGPRAEKALEVAMRRRLA